MANAICSTCIKDTGSKFKNKDNAAPFIGRCYRCSTEGFVVNSDELNTPLNRLKEELMHMANKCANPIINPDEY